MTAAIIRPLKGWLYMYMYLCILYIYIGGGPTNIAAYAIFDLAGTK